MQQTQAAGNGFLALTWSTSSIRPILYFLDLHNYGTPLPLFMNTQKYPAELWGAEQSLRSSLVLTFSCTLILSYLKTPYDNTMEKGHSL